MNLTPTKDVLSKGLILPSTLPGTGYRLRNKTTSPISISSNTSAPFAIMAGGAVEAKITVPSSKIISAVDNILGFCTASGRTNKAVEDFRLIGLFVSTEIIKEII